MVGRAGSRARTEDIVQDVETAPGISAERQQCARRTNHRAWRRGARSQSRRAAGVRRTPPRRGTSSAADHPAAHRDSSTMRRFRPSGLAMMSGDEMYVKRDTVRAAARGGSAGRQRASGRKMGCTRIAVVPEATTAARPCAERPANRKEKEWPSEAMGIGPSGDHTKPRHPQKRWRTPKPRQVHR